MIKAIGLTLVYAVAVSIVMNHFLSNDLVDSLPSVNNNSMNEMLTILSCVPGVLFFLDYIEKRDNSPK